jgi:hypothetical protein
MKLPKAILTRYLNRTYSIRGDARRARRVQRICAAVIAHYAPETVRLGGHMYRLAAKWRKSQDTRRLVHVGLKRGVAA